MKTASVVALAFVGLGVLLGSATGGCGARFNQSATDPASAPRARDRVRFSHNKHLRAQVECLACHEAVYDATSLGESYRPPEAKCLECHAEEKRRGNCGFCHSDARFATAWAKRDRHLNLSHARHIELVNEDCSRCHVRLPEPASTGPFTPPMAQCLSCHPHDEQYAEARCDACHQDLSRYPLRPVSVFSHEGNFVRSHRLVARTAGARCAQCHEQNFCTDCHAATVAAPVERFFPERVDSHFIHRSDFVSRHAIEQESSPATCLRCHGTSFCEGCHRAQNLSPAGTNPRDPHPAGWGLPGSASFHGSAARRDIARCASCHDQGPASNCVGCHRVGGIGGSPHPAGFGGRHGREEIRTNAMCGYCHPA